MLDAVVGKPVGEPSEPDVNLPPDDAVHNRRDLATTTQPLWRRAMNLDSTAVGLRMTDPNCRSGLRALWVSVGWVHRRLEGTTSFASAFPVP